MGFEQKDYTLVEGKNTTVCVTIDRNLEKEIVVKYFLALKKYTLSNNRLVRLLLNVYFFNEHLHTESGVLSLVIGENASQQNPLLGRQACFNISLSEDIFKKGIGLYTLTLESNDSCVRLGRDLALLTLEENGGKDNLVQ